MILIITFITDLRFIILRYKFGYIHRVEFASKFLENTVLNHFIQIIIMGGIILAGIILKYSKINFTAERRKHNGENDRNRLGYN